MTFDELGHGLLKGLRQIRLETHNTALSRGSLLKAFRHLLFFRTNTSSPHQGATVKGCQHNTILIRLHTRSLPGGRSGTGRAPEQTDPDRPSPTSSRKNKNHGFSTAAHHNGINSAWAVEKLCRAFGEGRGKSMPQKRLAALINAASPRGFSSQPPLPLQRGLAIHPLQHAPSAA